MPLLKIFVQTLDDAKTKKNGVQFATPEADRHKIGHLYFMDACIMEGGTTEGKASVLFRLSDDTGKEYYAELTAALLHALDSATRGAEIRFETEKTRKQ